MPQFIAGPGQGLPLPQEPYAAHQFLQGLAPFTGPTNAVSLGPAETLYIPAGQWIVSCTGTISALQWLNPVTQQWTNLLGPGATFATYVRSDGFSWRVANLSDWWYGGIVTAAGTGYVQSSTTITAGTGNSTWVAIVGGALGTFTQVTAGSGYTKPPIVFIPTPPPPGVAATATAALGTGGAAGTVASITIRTAGAGYLVAPPVILYSDPTDPSTAIVPATFTVALTGAGTVTAALLVNGGQLLTTAPTLTVNGVGSSATATTNPATVVAAANDVITIQSL
jgi:hypothetical protein